MHAPVCRLFSGGSLGSFVGPHSHVYTHAPTSITHTHAHPDPYTLALIF